MAGPLQETCKGLGGNHRIVRKLAADRINTKDNPIHSEPRKSRLGILNQALKYLPF